MKAGFWVSYKLDPGHHMSGCRGAPSAPPCAELARLRLINVQDVEKIGHCESLPSDVRNVLNHLQTMVESDISVGV
jgi:hypothetical protein